MPDSSEPLVSFIVPVHNRLQLFELTLQSILCQSYARLEVIVVNDHCSAQDADHLARLCSTDERVKLVAAERKGANHARNLGLASSHGQFITFMDADDLVAPDKVATQLGVFARYPGADAVVCRTGIFVRQPGDTDFAHNEFTSRNLLDRYLAQDVVFQTSAPLWRRATLEAAPPWREELQAHQDWEYHTILLAHCKQIVLHHEVLNWYRLPTTGNISSIRHVKYVEMLAESIEHVRSGLEAANAYNADRLAQVRSLWYVSWRQLVFHGQFSKAALARSKALSMTPPTGRPLIRALTAMFTPLLVLEGFAYRSATRAFALIGVRLPGQRSAVRLTNWVGAVLKILGCEREYVRWWLTRKLGPPFPPIVHDFPGGST